MNIMIIYIPLTDVSTMQTRLIDTYKGATRNIQVIPVDEDEVLTLPKIYGSVLEEEVLKADTKRQRPKEPSGSKTPINVGDLFYIQDKEKKEGKKEKVEERKGVKKEKDKLVKTIILAGEAGYGKTVLCLKVLDCWSDAKSSRRGTEGGKGVGSVEGKHMDDHTEGTRGSYSFRRSGKKLITKSQNESNDDDDDDDEENKKLLSCLALFDLVFYVPLRHAKHGTSSIIDLVVNSVPECDQRTKNKIKQMLRDDSIPCLVILDGLDEWRAPDTVSVRGFPNSDGLANCTLLCTMRPWKKATLRLGLDSAPDKVVWIHGLKRSSIGTVISNVLVNVCGLNLSSVPYKDKLKHFSTKAKLPELRSLTKSPLMLTTSCLVWYEETKDTSNEQVTSFFMTFFYLKLEKLTITRAENKHRSVKLFLDKKRQNPDMSLSVPNILLAFEQIIDFMEILQPVGRLALQDLVSDEPHLVFPKNKLEREIVELALKAGILSQPKSPGLSYQQRIGLSFYHKSIQEFIAALYMTCGGEEALKSFRTHCNTIDKVMELSNMIMFVCGLDPVVGSQLSEHVKSVVNYDADITQYRKRGEGMDVGCEKVKELYKIQCKWYSEMKQNLSYTHNTDKPDLRVTDVYLDDILNEDVSVDDVSVAIELVSMDDNSIASVYLNVRPNINNIIKQLPGCKYLTTLYIRNIRHTQDVDLLAEVLPQLLQLQCVSYGYGIEYRGNKSHPADTAVARAVQYMPTLKRIELSSITLTGTVTLPPKLEAVKIDFVNHAHFILSSLSGRPNIITHQHMPSHHSEV